MNTIKKKLSSTHGSLDGWDTLGVILHIAFFVILIGLIILYGGRAINKAYNRHEVVVEVNDKWIKGDRVRQKYLVSCTDVNNEREQMVFEITDSLFAFRWNSSDVYASIDVGKVYKMEVGGGRTPIMSWYPNIYKAEELVYSYETEVESETDSGG